jgi:hypothetical protein
MITQSLQATVGAVLLTAMFLAFRPVLAGAQERARNAASVAGHGTLVQAPSAEASGLIFTQSRWQ